MRAQLEKKLAQKEKEKKEQKLVELAQKAREERAGIRAAAGRLKVSTRICCQLLYIGRNG